MTRLIFSRESDRQQGHQTTLPPERILSGAPVFTSWDTQDGAVSAGIWCSTPDAQTMARDAMTWEFFHILDGEVELCDSEGRCERFGPGDNVVVPPNFKGNWRTLSAVRKTYVTLRHLSVPDMLKDCQPGD